MISRFVEDNAVISNQFVQISFLLPWIISTSHQAQIHKYPRGKILFSFSCFRSHNIFNINPTSSSALSQQIHSTKRQSVSVWLRVTERSHVGRSALVSLWLYLVTIASADMTGLRSSLFRLENERNWMEYWWKRSYGWLLWGLSLCASL